MRIVPFGEGAKMEKAIRQIEIETLAGRVETYFVDLFREKNTSISIDLVTGCVAVDNTLLHNIPSRRDVEAAVEYLVQTGILEKDLEGNFVLPVSEAAA